MLWTLKDLHNLGRLGSEEWDDYPHSLREISIGREEQSKSVIEDGEQPTYKFQSDRFHENLNAIIKPYAEVMREVYFDVDEISYIEHLPYPKPVILAAVKVYYAYFFLQGDDDSCKFLRQSFLAAASFQRVCEEDKVVLQGFFGKAKKKSDMKKGKTDSEFLESFESALRLLSNYKDKSNQEMDKYWDELATMDQYLSGLRSDRKTVEVLSEPVSFYLFATEHHPSLVETINSIQ